MERRVSRMPAYVLAGGRSARMGRDKAFLQVQGQAMAIRVAAALRQGGAGTVHLVGKDPELARLGLPFVADHSTIQHPLVGVVAALRHASSLGEERALLAPCDLPWLDAAAVALLLGHGSPCVAGDGVNRQPLLCVLDVSRAAAVAKLAAASGSVRAALAELPEVRVSVRALRNVNRPADLDRQQADPT